MKFIRNLIRRARERIADTDWADLAQRVRRTFLQVFVPAFSASFAINMGAAQLYATALSAASAGISAVWNMLAAGPEESAANAATPGGPNDPRQPVPLDQHVVVGQ